MKLIFIYLLVMLSTSSFASEDEHELPPGFSYFNEKSGEFALKEHVLRNFEIQISKAVEPGDSYEVPSEAIVRSLMKTEVFLKRNGRFKLVPVQVMSSSMGITKVSGDLGNSQIVIRGSNFLKTLQLSLEEGPAEGH